MSENDSPRFPRSFVPPTPPLRLARPKKRFFVFQNVFQVVLLRFNICVEGKAHQAVKGHKPWGLTDKYIYFKTLVLKWRFGISCAL
jgi:hypothetical protein